MTSPGPLVATCPVRMGTSWRSRSSCPQRASSSAWVISRVAEPSGTSQPVESSGPAFSAKVRVGEAVSYVRRLMSTPSCTRFRMVS